MCRGPGAADVLLPRRQREHIALPSLRIDGFADQMPDSRRTYLHSRREDAEVRPAERSGITERLPVGDHHIGAIGARGRNRPSAIGSPPRSAAPRRGGGIGEAVDRLRTAEEVGVLDDQRGGFAVEQPNELVEPAAAVFLAGKVVVWRRANRVLTTARYCGWTAGDLMILPRLPCPTSRARVHRLGERGGAVIMAGVAHVHAGEPANHALVFEQGLQHALARFRLILRI